jgi:hypothetical protein
LAASSCGVRSALTHSKGAKRLIRSTRSSASSAPIAFNFRQSSSTIVSDGETGNDPKNQTGNDLTAQGAFPAWIRGGVGLHAVAGARALEGRSTGGPCDRRPARCGHRDTRDATAVSTTHHSPSATAHAPHRSTCTRRNSSSAIGDPSAFKRQSRDSTDSELHIRSADHAMRETADEKKRRRRKYPATAESTGMHFVMTELLRWGFDAELAGASYEKHDMLVRVRGSRPKPIRIKTVHSAPWYVRWDVFAKRADQGDRVRPSWGRNCNARSVFRGQERRSRGPISSAADLESFWVHRRQIGG